MENAHNPVEKLIQAQGQNTALLQEILEIQREMLHVEEKRLFDERIKFIAKIIFYVFLIWISFVQVKNLVSSLTGQMSSLGNLQNLGNLDGLGNLPNLAIPKGSNGQNINQDDLLKSLGELQGLLGK